MNFPDDGVAVSGQPVGAACPVCHLPLQSAQIEDETVCYCNQCRGFLAPIDAFGRIVGKRRSRHGQHEQCLEPFDPAQLQRMLACPDCGGRMDAHPYSGGGNAVVDTCEACNLIWLDADELAVIERYVPHQHGTSSRRLRCPAALWVRPAYWTYSCRRVEEAFFRWTDCFNTRALFQEQRVVLSERYQPRAQARGLTRTRSLALAAGRVTHDARDFPSRSFWNNGSFCFARSASLCRCSSHSGVQPIRRVVYRTSTHGLARQTSHNPTTSMAGWRSQ